MTINFLHKRSSTADKRPTAANLDIGELALNYEGGDPGVYFEDDNGDIRKVGPITVGGTAPNSSPATGGSTGNSVGEGWLDNSVTPAILKIWNGTAWVAAGGTTTTPLNDGEIFVGNASNETEADAFTDVLSAQAGIVSTATSTALTISNSGVIVAGDMDVGNVGLTDSSSLAFFELSSNGSDHLTFKAPDNLSGTVNFTLPDGDGTSGQRLVTDGSGNLSWASSGAGALTNGNIFVGDASGLAADVSMSGDATIANTGAVTIANDAITTVKILDDAVTGDKIADNVALAGNPTTTTQTAGDNSTRIATTAYVDTSAGTKLDTTLNSAQIFVGNGSNEATGVAMSGDTTIDNTGAVTIANDAVTTVKILDDNVTGDKIVDDVALAGSPTTTTQAANDSSTKIATTAYVDGLGAGKLTNQLTSGNIFVGDAAGNATDVSMSGDATLSNSGALTIANDAITSAKIANDTIVNADVNSAAAIDYSKLAAMTSASILVGDNSNVPTVTAISGDVTLSDTGVVDIIDDVNLGGNPTTTTQADSDNSTRIATTAFVRTRVDNAIQGLSTKNSVLAATTTNITLSGTQTIDGVGLSVGDRVLVKNQTTASENGIYVVASGAWSRSDDANDWDELVGAFVFVESGTQQASSGYVDDILPGGTLGTDDIDWIQFSGAGQIDAGAGMTKNGSILDVGTASTARIVVNADDIDLATTGVAAGTYRSVTTDTYGRITSGTNPTTFSGYGIGDTSANLAAAITDETGTGSLVFAGSPALTGTPTAPTQTAGDNSTAIATTAYVDAADGNKLDTTLNSAQVFVGNASNEATGVALSGDATIDNTGALTIADDAVTTAKILDDNVTGDKIANDVALAGNPTTTTQSAGTNNTTIATTAYADTAVANIAGTYVDVAGDTMTGSLILDDTTLQITEATDTLTLGASALTADRAVNFQDAAGDIALVGTGSVDTRYVAVSGDEMTGNLQLANQSELRYGDSDNSNFIGFQAPATVSADVTFTLPDSDGTSGQVLSTDGSGTLSWATVSGGTNALNNGDIYVGNASNVATGVTMSGDATIDNTGALTIANDAITTVKITDANVTGAKIENNVALAGNPTTTTQTAGTNNTTIATTAYADTAVANIAGTYVDVAGDTMTGSLILDDTTLQIQEGTDTLTLGASALTADRAVNFQDVAGDIAIVGAGTVDTRYVATTGDTMTGALILDDTTLQIQEGTDTLTLGASALTAARSVNFQDAAGDIALVGAGSVDSRYSSSTLNSANIFVGNGSNVATGVAMSGDVTIDNAGATTIGNDAVTTAKIADDAVTFAKLENVSSGNIIVGNASNEAASVAVSGDVTMSNTGVVDIIDDVNLGGNPTTTTQADTDNSTRIATTAYVQTRVDNALQGLSTKNSVAAASTGNLTLSGTQTVDGISLSAGDRVLVKDQTTASENGIYEVATGSWTRTTDADTWDELVGAFVFVTAGTANADTGYTTQIVAGGTLDTDNIPWTQFSSAGQVSAGAGLTKTGSTIDVVTADSGRIVVNSNDIDLATTGVSAGTYRSVTTDTYGRITAGTNPTTFAGYGISDTSANLAAALTDETGTGSVVFSASPALTGSPTAPTQSAGTNNTTIATTAYADSAVAAISTTYVATAGDTMTGALILDDTSLQIQEGADTLTLTASALTADRAVNFQDAAGDIALVGAGSLDARYVAAAGDTMTGPLVMDDTSIQIQEGTDTLTLTASALTADRAVNFQDAAGDIALVGAGSLDARYVAVAGDTMTGTLEMAADILPDADSTRNLGSASLRFANVYTGDLHLRNDRGDYTLVEEEDALTIRNNKTGKVYNIMMQERQ